MGKTNLVWAIIWAVVALMSAIAFFWNPAHYITFAIAAVFAVLFWHDYRKMKNI